jgi:site-specific DNA-methyltransferase (adenine-specific)
MDVDVQCKLQNRVVCGDSLAVCRKLPAECVDLVITSPPYYRQRDYGTARQIGQEVTADLYIQRLADLFAELKRVVKRSGSAWLVVGDKYENGELLGMPWRICLALKQTGWKLRSDCIWHKPNAMPSSAKTRPTTDHEYVFFFSNTNDYYYNADAIREPHVTFSPQSRMKGGRNHFGKRGGTPEKGKNAGNGNLHDSRWDQAFHPLGRNKRTVWSIPLSKCRDAHFAVFPEQLVETCLLASCPPGGLVLDPFCGSGTTAIVAKRTKRDYFMIDCVKEYCRLTRYRIKQQGSVHQSLNLKSGKCLRTRC